MKKIIFLGIMMVLMVCSFVSADLIPEGNEPSTGNSVNPNVIEHTIIIYLILFSINLIVELIILVMFLIRQFSFWKILSVAFIANIITHPVATFGAIVFHKWFWIYFVIVEIIIWIAEAEILCWLFKKISFKKAMLVAFMANFVTAMLSFIPFLIG